MNKEQLLREIVKHQNLSEKDARKISDDIKKLMRKVNKKTIKGIDKNNYLIRLGQIVQVLKDEGFDVIEEELDKAFEKQFQLALEQAKELKIPNLTEIAEGISVEDLKLLTLQEKIKIEQTIFSKVEGLKSVILQQVVTGQIDEDRLLELAENYETDSYTLINTGLSTLYNSTTIAQAINAGQELFIYFGPEDDLTRPFCDEVLSKDPPIYTLDEILLMDNEQGLDTITAGGGYNCRHEFRPITLEFAKSLGYQEDV